MYTLYSKNGSCSMAVHVLLNELGEKVTLVPFQIDGETNPELKKINPRENVPVIQKGDFNMREGGAILSWLCDEHGSELLPRKGPERAKALQWLMFANATLHPAYGRAFFLIRNADKDKDALLETAITGIQSLWDEVEEQLGKGEYICGAQMTVADILLTVIANWSQWLPKPISFGPKSKAFFARIIARPSYQKALAEEKVEYKVAA